MKKFILRKIEESIRKQYPKYDNDKIDTIMYGIEGLYITIEKSIVIFTLAAILHILKPLLLLLLFFNIIRMFAFGMHAPNGIICLIISSTVFLFGAYLSKILYIDNKVLIIIYLICFILITIFSPADTIKRPLIKKSKRIRFKVLSMIIVISFLIISLYIKNNIIINSMCIAIIIECILINPLTYKMFNLPYNNYKNYGLNT